MCRWVAYRGPSIFMDELITKPERSLIHQSLHAEEAKTETNGDGFGIGWYGQREKPGLYREILPAWNDENLKHLSYQIQSNLFFAHVRASTGTATNRVNCHPYTYGRWMFMHNGQIGGYWRVRRRLEADLPDALYMQRKGTTDSELLFLLMVAEGLDDDPHGAVIRVLRRVVGHMQDLGIEAPLRFTAALTDGNRIYAFRCASDTRPPSLYYRRDEDGSLIIVSEPLDSQEGCWRAVGAERVLCADDKGVMEHPLELEAA